MLPDNHVLITSYQTQDGFMNRTAGNPYASVVDADITADRGPWLLPEFRDYLDQYFTGWRLLCEVEERQRDKRSPRYKDVAIVLALDTNADAETVRSRLRKGDFGLP